MGILLEILGVLIISASGMLFGALSKSLSVPIVVPILVLIVCDLIGLALIEKGYDEE